MVGFLLVILIAVVLGIAGVAGGLVYLLVIGCVLLALDVVYGVLRLGWPGPGRRQR